MNESEQHPRYTSQRVIASLNREQVDFLDKIGKDAQFSSGVKLSRTQILAAMVNVMRCLELSGEGVKNIDEFEQQILKTVLRHREEAQQDGEQDAK
jgi:hypothetical protein